MMATPIASFEDILHAMERNPTLGDLPRRHILTDELLQVPVRLDRMDGELARTGGDVRRLAGTDYEPRASATSTGSSAGTWAKTPASWPTRATGRL